MNFKTSNLGIFVRLAVVGMFLTQSLQSAEDWPEFRGPTGQGLSQAGNVPDHWSTTSNIVWKTAIPGEGWSSPVLSDGKVYLTSAVRTVDSNRTSLRALCIAGDSGTVLWNVEVFQPEMDGVEAMHNKNSLASPTPILRDDRIYVHFGHMGTAALDLNGNVLWQQTALKFSPRHGNGGSPELVDGLLIFNCDGEEDPFIAALDAGTGEIKWKTPRNSNAKRQFSFSTPLAIEVNGTTQVISPGSGFVGAYDPKDGREIWRVDYGEGFSVISRPVFEHGLVFISSGFMRPQLYAINPAGAKGDVTDSHVAWTHSKGVPNTPSPLVIGDELYIVSDGGIASCMDARTGAIHWYERLGGGFSASPIHADGRLYFQNEEGLGFVLKAGKAFELLAENDLGERTLASVGVVDDRLYLRSESHLWCIGE